MLALILGCVSLVFGGLCLAIPALVLANGALKVTSQHPGHPDESNANFARIVSIIGIVISVAGILLAGLIFGGNMYFVYMSS